MAYSVNKTDGSLLVSLLDGTADTTATSLTLIGKNFRGYGESLNENFIKILENFARSTAPANPLRGQIWYDTTNEQIKVYNGTSFDIVGPLDATSPLVVSTSTVSGNSSVGGNLSVTGNSTFTGDLEIGDVLYVGSGARAYETSASLTDVISVMNKSANSFVQSALHNASSGTEASTDFIAYMDIGDNDSGWVDMGVTSSNFVAAAFGITNAGDGYLFMSAPSGAGLGGNLVIATDSTGSTNDIIFATNGFTSTTEQGRFISDDGFRVKGNLISQNGSVYQGPNARDNIDTTSVSTTLNGSIDNIVTTITVVSTTGFKTKGIIIIDSEEIKYSGKNATQFTGCTRGLNGTTAASHSNGATVDQDTFAGLTNATAIFTGDVDDFVQFALRNENTGSSASTDFIAYASDGDNNSGWIDMGITSETYADPSFTVTGPGTGYLFFSAPSSTIGTGDLLLGTDHTGSQNDIVFFTNGFAAGNERVRIVGQNRVGTPAGVEVYISTASTSTSTGALRVQGGIGLQGNLNVGGNVNIVGNITLGGGGNTVETDTLAVANPVIFMGDGNPSNLLDLGFAGEYNVASTELYTGLIKDASDGYWKLFSNIPIPTSTANFAGADYDTLYLGNVRAVSNVASTTSTTGTIIVTGGIGVSGNVVVGGTFQGTATSAQYADLAEKYLADQDYEIGTVVTVGGPAEVRACIAGDRAIGTVSANPAFMMNKDLENGTYIALKGRVPCKVIGSVRKGDRLVAGNNGHAEHAEFHQYPDVFAIALESNDNNNSKIIEVLVL